MIRVGFINIYTININVVLLCRAFLSCRATCFAVCSFLNFSNEQ